MRKSKEPWLIKTISGSVTVIKKVMDSENVFESLPGVLDLSRHRPSDRDEVTSISDSGVILHLTGEARLGK